MVDYNFIKNVYNIKFDNKKKSLEQYESFINISLLNIETCESYINSIEFFKNCDVNYENFDIKLCFKYLKYMNLYKIPGRIYFFPQDKNDLKFYNFEKYIFLYKFIEELENLFRKKKEYNENYFFSKKKEIIKIKKRETHKEKFKMCIHKFKMSLPDYLIYKIGNFL